MKKITALFLMLSMLGICASAATVPDWFVPDGWSVSNTAPNSKAAIDITESKSGNASFKTEIPQSSSDGSVKIIQKVTGLSPSESYTFSFWAKCENVGYFKIIRDSIYSTDAAEQTEGWYQKSISFTTGKSSYAASFQFMIKGAGSTVRIDDCSLKKDGSDEELLTNGGFEEGLCLTPPKTIDGFFAIAKNGAVKLYWDKADKTDKINIYTDGELTDVISAEQTSYTVSGLDNEREYTFLIKSVDSWGNESPVSECKATPSENAVASVVEYGADGSDSADDTRAFEKALSDDGNIVIVPEGTYYISTLNIPENKALKASGKAILKTLSAVNEMLVMSNKSSVDGITLINEAECKKGISVVWSKDVSISNCEIFGFLNNGIYNDHGNGMTVDNTAVKNTAVGIESVFASDIKVTNCYVKNSSMHGIQFWNNDNGTMVGGNHYYENNVVMSCGGGGIWGTGAEKVKMYCNKIDDCGDVGLDLEYCNNGIIKYNTVSRCANAGISVFHGSDNVIIAENTIFNNYPNISSKNVSAGIWITRIDSSVAYDSGNKNIDIVNNTIYNSLDSDGRRGIFLPVKKDNIKYNYMVSGNKISGGGSKILLLIGKEYNYPEDGFVFSKNGDSSTEAVDGGIESAYELVQSTVPNVKIGRGETTAIGNEAKGMGTYAVEFELNGELTSVNISAVDKEQNKMIASASAAKINSAGNSVYTLKFDSLGGNNIEYEISSNSMLGAELKSVKVYAAKLPFVQILSDRYGIEYLNNSHTKLKTILKIYRPEKNGIKSYFSIEKITDCENRNSALYRE